MKEEKSEGRKLCACRFAYLVDLADGDRLHARVLDDLANDTAITAADDEHMLRIRVREERQVSDHLLVRALITIGQLNHTIEDEDIAKRG
jgi:hypothetical protein